MRLIGISAFILKPPIFFFVLVRFFKLHHFRLGPVRSFGVSVGLIVLNSRMVSTAAGDLIIINWDLTHIHLTVILYQIWSI